MAESVAIVIEVKSNLSNQWEEVLSTSEKVSQIRRKFSSDSYQEILNNLDQGRISHSSDMDIGRARRGLERLTQLESNIGEERIKFFVVGYKGWARNETITSKLIDNQIDGILQINRRVLSTKIERAEGFEAIEGYKSLLGVLQLLEKYFLKVPDRFGATSLY